MGLRYCGHAGCYSKSLNGFDHCEAHLSACEVEQFRGTLPKSSWWKPSWQTPDERFHDSVRLGVLAGVAALWIMLAHGCYDPAEVHRFRSKAAHAEALARENASLRKLLENLGHPVEQMERDQ